MTAPGPNPLLAASRQLVAFAWRAAGAWRIGLVVLAVGLAGAVYAPRAIQPRYKSESLLANRESIRAGGDDERNDNRRFGAKLKEMLLARSKLETIVKELKLYPGVKDPVAAVDKFRLEIQFKANEDTFLIGYEASDPELAANTVRRLAESLVEESARLRRERASASKEFLEEQKQRADEDLKTAERRLADFVRQHPEYATDAAAQRRAGANAATSAGASGGGNGGDAMRSALERQAARLRERLEGAPPPAANLGPSPQEQQLDAQIAAVQRDVDEKKQRYTDQHPDLVAARKKLTDLKAERAELARQSAAPPAELSDSEKAAIRAQMTRINALLGKPKVAGPAGAGATVTTNNEAEGIVKMETEWARVERDQVEARERSKQLEDRLFKATIALNVEELGGATQLTIVDRAYVPVAPLKNSKTKVFAIGIVVAVVLALISMLVAGFFDSRIVDLSQIAKLDVAPMLLSIEMPPSALPKTSGRRG
jgi:uncharacterized protein involved in exopolysaccharide biosynthesis